MVVFKKQIIDKRFPLVVSGPFVCDETLGFSLYRPKTFC